MPANGACDGRCMPTHLPCLVLCRRGRGVGINFDYGGNMSQTTSSHRLMEKSREVGGEAGQLKMAERLFKTYFEEQGDPGDHNLLSRDAETVGIMSRDEVRLSSTFSPKCAARHPRRHRVHR